MYVTVVATTPHFILFWSKSLPELVRGQPKKAVSTLREHRMTGTNISVILFCLFREEEFDEYFEDLFL